MKHWKPFVITVQRAVWTSTFASSTGWQKAPLQEHRTTQSPTVSPTPHSNPAAAERDRARGTAEEPKQLVHAASSPSQANRRHGSKSIMSIIYCRSVRHGYAPLFLQLESGRQELAGMGPGARQRAPTLSLVKKETYMKFVNHALSSKLGLFRLG